MKDEILYLECYSGISGDMTVAALLDLGADREKLNRVLATVPVEGFRTEITRVNKAGIDACDFDVILDHENHDHDMEYLYGHTAEHHHGKEKDHHEKDGHQVDGEHHHEHRNLADVTAIIDGTEMTEKARNLAKKIFGIVAEAESRVHGLPLDQVHFHEVGATDSIVDIISVAVLVDDLDCKEIVVSPLYEGQGQVRCQHGLLSVPVPAVTEIIKSYQLPVHITEIEGELVTPTGAAIAAALKNRDGLPEQFSIAGIGYGAGKRVYDCPGYVRALRIREEAAD